jgi:hypothetical protein
MEMHAPPLSPDAAAAAVERLLERPCSAHPQCAQRARPLVYAPPLPQV